MNDTRHPKFIIENGNLIIGMVTFHKQLVTDKAHVIGGGWFGINRTSNTMIFFGESHDFGKATFEQIKACITAGKVFDRRVERNIFDKFKFGYNTGSEIIELPKV